MNISNLTKKNNGKSRSKMPTSCEKARKAAAERKRKERERIKQDPEKYELMKQKEKERSRQRRESKKIKSINDLSERGKRKQRAEWRKRYHKHAEKLRKQKVNDEITDLNTPPSSPNPVQNIVEPERDSRKESRKVNRKKKLRKTREKYKAKIKELEKQLKDQIKKTNRWKTRHHRLTKKVKSTKKCATNKKVCNAPQQTMNKRKSKTLLLKKKVKEFLTDDDNSYSTPGRKDTITKKKIKMQKRYLSDSLLILHKKFVSSTNIKISYALFCRLKPFWVLHRPTNKRDTCLCKYHENFWFLFQKCKQYRLIQHTNIRDLVSSVCCDLENKKCMYRECEECEPRTITFNENCHVPLQSMIHFFEWKNLKEEKMKKGKQVMVKVTRKVKEHCTLEELKNKLLTSLRPFMQHMYRVYHQSKFSKTLRTSLNDDEVFMVVDFSENYQLKYSTEIQSRHFGASNEQLVLHTGAYFLSKTVNDKKDISVSTFCTVSANNRHDASAIWAHLQPIFVKIKNENNQVTRVHIMSDGPTKQYRNKSNLYLFCHFMQHFGFQEASYNFSESGHGKSVADGVGGVVKRTADKAVLAGKDISTIDEFLCCVSMLKAEIIKIEDSSLAVTDQILNAALDTIIPVPNTMKIHQATWNLNEPLNLNCRYLSCEFCRTSSICSHIKTVTHTILKPKETSEESTEDDIAEEPTDDIMEEPGPSSHSNEKTSILFKSVLFLFYGFPKS